jgi:hypothetical protein
VDRSIIPTPHPDPWVDLLRDYATSTVWALASHNLLIWRSCLDPVCPRDVTIVFSRPSATAISPGLRALVWDEETGWRQGRFEAGQPGVRTRLTGVTYLGGGVLPTPEQVARRVIAKAAAPARAHRSSADIRDGIDDALRRQVPQRGIRR